jgi:predicted transposase YbfD/YdcC
VFAQAKAEEKSDGVTAIPALLEKTALKGRVAAIDAMGCQCKTANQMANAGAL